MLKLTIYVGAFTFFLILVNHQLFFVCFLFCCVFMYGWNFTDAHNFTLQHHRESFTLCVKALLYGTYQLRLCALELLLNEFTGGINDDPHNSTHLRGINNTATHYTDLGRIEG